jgi:hypothetical protein
VEYYAANTQILAKPREFVPAHNPSGSEKAATITNSTPSPEVLAAQKEVAQQALP